MIKMISYENMYPHSHRFFTQAQQRPQNNALYQLWHKNICLRATGQRLELNPAPGNVSSSLISMGLIATMD